MRRALLLVGGALLLCSVRARAEEPGAPGPDLVAAAPAADDAHHRAGEGEHDPETIVVTGSPIEHDRDELAIPVDRLDRDELLERLGATLGETLATRPGIATSGFSGGASRPVIRGQDAFRTEVTEDGLPTQDVSRESPDHAVPVNPLAVQRVEVVRGPATLRYGGGATAGVVNAITNRIPDARSREPIRGELFGAIDSVADRRDVYLDLDGGAGPVGWHLDGLLRRSDDYRIPGGGRQNGTFVDAFSGSAGGSYFHGDVARLGVSYSRFESDYGIPEQSEDARIEMGTHRVGFEGDWTRPRGGVRQLRLRGVYTDYEHDEKVDGIVGQTFRNDQFDGRLELLHDPIAGFVGALGITGRFRDFEARGEAFEYLAPSETGMAAFYLFEERELWPALVGELGLRVEGTTVEGTPRGAARRVERSFVPVSGSLGLVYAPREDLSFGLLAAASQRAPEAVELFARGPHEATGTFETGDPSLDEETSFTAELRVAFERERVRAEAAGFFTHYRDYIFGFLTGNRVDEQGMQPGDLEELEYRARDAHFAGTEISARADLFDALGGTFGVDGQFDGVWARFTSGPDHKLPRIPPIRWGGGVFYRGAWLRGRIGFLRHEAQKDVSSFPTGAFTFLNASLFLSLAPLYDRVPVELGIQGTNLTDARGRNAASFKADELLLPGRNVRGTLSVRF